MREKIKFKTKKALWGLAVISACIATLEGILFYHGDKFGSLFFRILLVLQNSINAFAFKPSISIKDAISFMEASPTILNIIVSYLYGIAVFTAPYCTIAAVYKLLEHIFRFLLVTKAHKNDEHIVIFGYNEDVKVLLNNAIALQPKMSDKQKHIRFRKPKYCIHIVEPDGISPEENFKLTKKGYFVHQFDFRNASCDELDELLNQTSVGKARFILLMEDSSIQNFSLLQMFRLSGTEEEKVNVLKNAKIFCRCEDNGVERLIADYFDNGQDKEQGAWYDLELFSFPEYQVRAMYADTPLYTYYDKSELPIASWDINLLIIGFGKIGQQALLQAMNNGVIHGENKIRIDVVDYNIKEKAGIFSNCFSDEMFEMCNDFFKMRSVVSDGSFEVHFHNLDVRYRQFHSLINEMAQQCNYVVLTLPDTTTAMHCALELEEAFAKYEKNNVPIIMRMDYDKRVAEYVTNNQKTFGNVKIMKDRKKLLTLDDIVNERIDRKAKEYNFFYNSIKIGIQNGNKVNPKSAEKLWNNLAIFRRDSNRAAANHENVKARFVEKILAEYGENKEEQICDLVGSKGKLLRYISEGWLLGCEPEQLEQAFRDNRFGYEMVKMEHRRWNYFMLSRGWSLGERSDIKRTNPYIMPQEELMKKDIMICQYDLMYLLAEYKRTEEKN